MHEVHAEITPDQAVKFATRLSRCFCLFAWLQPAVLVLNLQQCHCHTNALAVSNVPGCSMEACLDRTHVLLHIMWYKYLIKKIMLSCRYMIIKNSWGTGFGSGWRPVRLLICQLP